MYSTEDYPNPTNESDASYSEVIEDFTSFTHEDKKNPTSLSCLIPSSCGNCLPIKSGWLLKRTSGLIHRWVKRFFTLRNKVLTYCYAESDKTFAGIVNFDLITSEIQVNSNIITLKAIGCKKLLMLKAENEKSAISWANAISLHIQISQGQNIKLPVSSKNFWKFGRISEKQFLSVASTGDILLFKANNFVSKMQRVFTHSEYDHVAIILKYTSGRIGILEATSEDGVSVVMWDDFKYYQFHKLYNRLVYRQLHVERSNEMLMEIENFIKSVKGMKYNISPRKLIRNKEDNTKQQGFFCSELAAAAYKYIGLLPEKPPASKYWPGDFSEKKKLQLLKGARCGEELIIDFNLDSID